MLIDYYRAIEEGSAKMLAAAKTANWEAVMQLEGSCAVLIEQLKAHAKSEALDAASRAEKTRIMLRILNNDAQVRDLVEPWLDAIHSHTNSSGFLH